jgi:hypothetical protein
MGTGVVELPPIDAEPGAAVSNVEVQMPDELVAGTYADFVAVWHSRDSFTLDFAALAGPQTVTTNEAGQSVPTGKARVVARVRIPPGQVFELMKALEKQLTQWEQATGARRER